MDYTFTITLYNLDLLAFLIAWLVSGYLLYKLGKALKKAIGKLIIRLEKKGVL